ncbi:sigma-Y antisigma factor component [Halobacillus sp. ACCC02827]|uniref:hypothetical protein n=1 Tax=Bacillaceae TaxID=186817 RepID=UPI0004075584|nr:MULTISPECIES: hypothetical protein [Bacillaceae]QHT45813.1 sigma-Y antisigma factor component [Bacillus sp. SB49]WJE16615.1 sigma-Y antisigma factor component [Halobacillus sp. ACCC02827]
MKQYGPEDIPLWGFLLLGTVLLTQSSILFIKARRIDKAPWFWGLIGIIQFPVPSILFFILRRTVWRETR